MKFKLRLVKDGEVLWEIPLSPEDWAHDDLEAEINNLRNKFNRYHGIFDALHNQNRVRMLCSLMENENRTMRFTDFIEALQMNPKTVRENAIRLYNAGLIETPHRGTYRISEKGQFCFIIVGFALRRMLNSMEDR